MRSSQKRSFLKLNLIANLEVDKNSLNDVGNNLASNSYVGNKTVQKNFIHNAKGSKVLLNVGNQT